MEQMILELAPAPEPSLDNFFPGRNGPALEALHRALDGTERFVYLWGTAGGGKTHLLRACSVEAQKRGRQAAYAHAEQFTAPATAEALAADDVQALDIVGQLALFDAYNALLAMRGTLVASGDRPPRELPLREDLRTRLGSCVAVQMHPLADEEKRAALLDHAAARGLRLGDEIVEYLLARHARDMGTLVALLDALDRYSLQTRRAITLPLLREALRR
jgi:DnaA-homolog protein